MSLSKTNLGDAKVGEKTLGTENGEVPRSGRIGLPYWHLNAAWEPLSASSNPFALYRLHRMIKLTFQSVLLSTQMMVLFLDLWSSLILGILYLSFSGVPYIFTMQYHLCVHSTLIEHMVVIKGYVLTLSLVQPCNPASPSSVLDWESCSPLSSSCCLVDIIVRLLCFMAVQHRLRFALFQGCTEPSLLLLVCCCSGQHRCPRFPGSSQFWVRRFSGVVWCSR